MKRKKERILLFSSEETGFFGGGEGVFLCHLGLCKSICPSFQIKQLRCFHLRWALLGEVSEHCTDALSFLTLSLLHPSFQSALHESTELQSALLLNPHPANHYLTYPSVTALNRGNKKLVYRVVRIKGILCYGTWHIRISVQ